MVEKVHRQWQIAASLRGDHLHGGGSSVHRLPKGLQLKGIQAPAGGQQLGAIERRLQDPFVEMLIKANGVLLGQGVGRNGRREFRRLHFGLSFSRAGSDRIGLLLVAWFRSSQQP